LIQIKKIEREMKKARRNLGPQAEPQADGVTVRA